MEGYAVSLLLVVLVGPACEIGDLGINCSWTDPVSTRGQKQVVFLNEMGSQKKNFHFLW